MRFIFSDASLKFFIVCKYAYSHFTQIRHYQLAKLLIVLIPIGLIIFIDVLFYTIYHICFTFF